MDKLLNLGADVNVLFDGQSSTRLGLTIFVSITLALIVALYVYGKFIR